MYECSYCGSVLPSLPATGSCPNCRASAFKAVAEKIVKTVRTEYALVPAGDYYRPSYARSPISAARSSFYGLFGYRWATLLLIVIALFLAWQIYVAFFTGTSKPTPPISIPTIQPTRAFVEPVRPFAGIEFLSASQSEALRTQKNVIHVAVLGDGYGARYMAGYAVILDTKIWTKVGQVFGLTALTVNGSSVSVQADTVTYAVNRQQGFVLAARPGKIYMVDTDNSLWEIGYSTQLLVSVEKAQSQLSAPIPPNGRLSLTLK